MSINDQHPKRLLPTAFAILCLTLLGISGQAGATINVLDMVEYDDNGMQVVCELPNWINCSIAIALAAGECIQIPLHGQFCASIRLGGAGGLTSLSLGEAGAIGIIQENGDGDATYGASCSYGGLSGSCIDADLEFDFSCIGFDVVGIGYLEISDTIYYALPSGTLPDGVVGETEKQRQDISARHYAPPATASASNPCGGLLSAPSDDLADDVTPEEVELHLEEQLTREFEEQVYNAASQFADVPGFDGETFFEQLTDDARAVIQQLTIDEDYTPQFEA